MQALSSGRPPSSSTGGESSNLIIFAKLYLTDLAGIRNDLGFVAPSSARRLSSHLLTMVSTASDEV